MEHLDRFSGRGHSTGDGVCRSYWGGSDGRRAVSPCFTAVPLAGSIAPSHNYHSPTHSLTTLIISHLQPIYIHSFPVYPSSSDLSPPTHSHTPPPPPRSSHISSHCHGYIVKIMPGETSPWSLSTILTALEPLIWSGSIPCFSPRCQFFVLRLD